MPSLISLHTNHGATRMLFTNHPLLRGVYLNLVVFILMLGSSLTLAHHGIATKFDPAKTLTVKGRVARVDWSFPHVHIFLLVTDGTVELPWYIELESPSLLEASGWQADAINIGDVISVSGNPARDDSRQIWGDSITATSTGSAVFTMTTPSLLSTIATVDTKATPRWPTGQPRLGAEPGEEGYWVPTLNVLQETGVAVDMAANGQLLNLNDAAKVAPLQDWALRLYEKRQQDFLRSDPTYLGCRPPSGPRKFLEPYGIQLLEDQPLDRIFVIAGGGNHDWQLIYTDGRALDGGFQLDDGNLLYYGRNVGAWEGDTFVIESEGYNEKFWLPGGLPHTEQMHVTERLTRTDFSTLNYEITINDPGAYTRNWSSSWTLKWLAGQDPPEHYCQDNRL